MPLLIQAYRASDLPENEEELGQWCKERFADKEKTLATLYERANEGVKCEENAHAASLCRIMSDCA